MKIQSGRIDFPREFPYYIGWNKQISNVPGSTIFLPVVDCTRQYINSLLILLSEPKDNDLSWWTTGNDSGCVVGKIGKLGRANILGSDRRYHISQSVELIVRQVNS